MLKEALSLANMTQFESQCAAERSEAENFALFCSEPLLNLSHNRNVAERSEAEFF